jgi:hypothetical protein
MAHAACVATNAIGRRASLWQCPTEELTGDGEKTELAAVAGANMAIPARPKLEFGLSAILEGYCAAVA